MNSVQLEHSYEELREVVITVMLDAKNNGVDQFEKLLEKASLELRKQDEFERQQVKSPPPLHPNDAELVLEIVWDLFRQGIVTLGSDPLNPCWPWLRLSRFGEYALQHGPYRFHNKAEFMKAFHSDAIDLSPESIVYLREAVTAFYTNSLLSACVTLSIAAECEFLRLLDVAQNSKTYAIYFARIGDGLGIRSKISRFREAIRPMLTLLSKSTANELDNTLNTMQSFIRTVRNESDQPSGANPPSRDQVYVYLQLFIPFAEQLMRLRRELVEPDYPRLICAT